MSATCLVCLSTCQVRPSNDRHMSINVHHMQELGIKFSIAESQLRKLERSAQLEYMMPGYPHPPVFQDILPALPGLPKPGSGLRPLGQAQAGQPAVSFHDLMGGAAKARVDPLSPAPPNSVVGGQNSSSPSAFPSSTGLLGGFFGGVSTGQPSTSSMGSFTTGGISSGCFGSVATEGISSGCSGSFATGGISSTCSGSFATGRISSSCSGSVDAAASISRLGKRKKNYVDDSIHENGRVKGHCKAKGKNGEEL